MGGIIADGRAVQTGQLFADVGVKPRRVSPMDVGATEVEEGEASVGLPQKVFARRVVRHHGTEVKLCQQFGDPRQIRGGQPRQRLADEVLLPYPELGPGRPAQALFS